MSRQATNLVWAESPSKAEKKPARHGSLAQPCAELSANQDLQNEIPIVLRKNQNYVNPPAGSQDANSAAPVDLAAIPTSNAAAQVRRNWADITEEVNPGAEEGFTLVQGRKRRRGSADSPTAAAPSSNSGGARSSRRLHSSARSIPRAQEIPTTSTHITEARARQASSSEEHCVYLEHGPELQPFHYLRALDRLLGGTAGIIQISKVNGHQLLGLANRGLAERLINNGLEVEGTILRAFPFRKRAERITVSNLPFFVEDSAIINALRPFGRITSIAPKMMKAGPYTYTDGRREAFIVLHEGMTTERLPTRLDITIKGEAWPAYLSTGIKCSRCHGQGHRRANCPLLAGLANNTRTAPPTTPAGVPPPTTPAPPQRSAAQPPAPTPSNPAMEVCSAPPVARAALHSSAPRPSPPAAPAFPMEETPPAPPPVTPAPSLQTPGSREPAAPTPDVEMSIVEETLASFTSSAKNATRVDLDAFIEGHPSVSFAKTNALGLGREEVLDLLSSRTKAQRKGPLMSPPQCDALVGLIGQILDLRPGAASNLYKVLGQVKAELRTTPAVPPTPTLPAPWPSKPTPPALHGEKTSPDIATPPPPLSTEFIDACYDQANDIIYELSDERYSEPLSDIGVTEGDIVEAIIFPDDREPLLRRLSTQKRTTLAGIVSAASERARSSDPFVLRRNWADITEEVNPGAEEGFTLVQGKKRRRGSANSPTAAAPSSNAGGSRTIRRPQPSAGSVPRAQEIRVTRAHIAEARARQASSSEENCVYIKHSPEMEPFHYLRALDRMLGGTAGVIQITKVNGHQLLGLTNRGLAERLISEGLEGIPFPQKKERITVGNLPFFIGDSAVINALSPYGRVTSIAPKQMKAGPYVYVDGRRDVFITLHEGITIERLPTRLDINIKGEAWPASSGIRCSRCHGQGHRRAICPLLAGLASNTRMAPPTTPAGVPPPTTPAPPQRSAAQPPAPTPSNPAMEPRLRINSSTESTMSVYISREYVNPPADGGNANLAAARVNVISGAAATSSSNGAALAIRNWADCDEVVNPGTADDFTGVKTKKRRRESSNSPTAATPSSNSGGARSGRRVQSSARSVPRAQEIPTTRAHIAEARARQTSSAEEHCVYLEHGPELQPFHYLRALYRLLGGNAGLVQVSKVNSHQLLGLANRGVAERLINNGLEVEGTLLRAFPFRKRAERITVGNLPFFVEDLAIIKALGLYGRITSIAPKMMKAGPYTYTDGRREAFIVLHEGVTTERLPTRLNITIKGEAWPAYLSSGIKCSRCHGQGHRRANCPLLAGRTTAPGPATPTSPTSVPPATAPRLPQQPSAQPPPPASPSPTMEVSDVPPTSRAALHPPAALRQPPPAPSALPAEDASPAPPPVTLAPSLRTPGSREPAAPTPDVEMSIVEETSASSTSSAKNATRVDLDAFIERHPSVSFAKTDALGLGREEVLDLLSSRTKAQRKGPLLSLPQCDALAGLIGQILDLRPGAASTLYKVLGQVKAELRPTPAAVPTPPPPAPRPAEPTSPALHGERTSPDIATPPPPLSTQFIDACYDQAGDIIYALSRERFSEPLSNYIGVTEGDIVEAIIFPVDREPLLRRLSTQKRTTLAGIVSAASERARNSDPFGREGLRILLASRQPCADVTLPADDVTLQAASRHR
ncbi:hypothetical protein LAZ67_3001649 [Cordylochernes scorpioides]|uniref:CCHC-type domain-containing protein n=1 Tax=Cordylochernes scorpioides TaxID=51811 RepID=A0ABY6K8T9_9ARAC|nr:hypothetical protein LAZ67_3001649 [Cordylochernes scorpioides]